MASTSAATIVENSYETTLTIDENTPTQELTLNSVTNVTEIVVSDGPPLSSSTGSGTLASENW